MMRRTMFSSSLVLLLVLQTAQHVVVRAQPLTLASNDNCSGAILFSVDNGRMIGNLTRATADGPNIPLRCNGVVDDWLGTGIDVDKLGARARGLWYGFTALSRRTLFTSGGGAPASQQRVDVLVYKGTTCAPAAELQCVTKFTLDPSFTMTTQVGASYRVLVRQNLIYNVFAFDISTQLVPNSLDNDNDRCINAVPTVVQSNRDSAAGLPNVNITYATSDELDVTEDCVGTGTVDHRFPGIWYTFVGTGTKLIASTGSNTLRMSVYTGTCGAASLQCVAGSRVSGVRMHQLVVYTQLGTLYHVLVQLNTQSTSVGSMGGVTQPLLLYPMPTEDDIDYDEFFRNDVCTKAKPVSIGTSFYGSLLYAAFQSETVVPPSCIADPGPGMWYTFVGTGRRVTAVSPLCNDPFIGNGAVSTVHVYKGTACGPTTLRCVASFSVTPCDPAPFTFHTEAGATYYMLVQSVTSQYFHEFNITLVNGPLSINDNDVCSKATPIAMGAAIRRNNITLATTDEKDVAFDCACGSVSTSSFTRGLWYTFQGIKEEHVWIDLCSGANSSSLLFRAKVSVYQGTCGNPSTMSCVAGNTFVCGTTRPQKFLVPTIAGTQYHVLVQNLPVERFPDSINPRERFAFGDVERQPTSLFDIAISSVVTPVNDICLGASSIAINSTVFGDFSLATADIGDVTTFCSGYDFVDGFAHFPGVWYTFQGTGGHLKLSFTCRPSSPDYGPIIHVYKGSCDLVVVPFGEPPNKLQCVTGFRNQCITPQKNEVTFATEAGSTYYVLVQQTPADETGAPAVFSFELQSANPPSPSAMVLSNPVVALDPPKECLVIAPTHAAPIAPITIVVTTPAPIAPAPIPIAAAPVPIGSAPIPVGSAPVPMGSAPVPVASAPVPVGSAPVPTALAPVPVGSDPVPVNTSPVVASPIPPPQTKTAAPASNGPPPVPLGATTPISPKQPPPSTPVATAPPPVALAPVRPTTTGGRCSLGCRIRRVFRNIFS